MKHFATSDGLRLAFDDRGAGVPLLCLAGLTRNGEDFDHVVAQFGARCRIIRLDSRGRGASDHDPEPVNYTILRESEDAIALLDHLGIDRAAILGTSRGGLIAMTLAATHHDRLRGVLLNDIGPVIDGAGLDFIMTYLGKTPPYRSFAEAGAALAGSMAGSFPGVPAEVWADHARRIWREVDGGLALRYDPALRIAVEMQSAAGPAPDLWPLFDALAGLPVGLIRGANSDILSEATASEMRRRRPDMIFAEVPDRGHVPFLDEPESRRAIGAFLDRLT